jgi:hypothetical protein
MLVAVTAPFSGGGVMPYAKEAEVVLAIWREIERDLAKAEPGSDEEDRLHAEAMRLRDEYQRLMALARAAGRPEPAPWPDADLGLAPDGGY